MNEQNIIPFITTEQMREVDRLMIDAYGITLPRMMENAGRNLARLAQRLFLKTKPTNPILIMTGSGGNGGGALVCARYLHNWGHEVQVILSKTADIYRGVPLEQLTILKKLGIAVKDFAAFDKNLETSLIVDGLIGYSLKGIASGTSAKIIQWANSQNSPVLALDLPSGLHGTKGYIGDPVIKASATLTLALPKNGLAEKAAKQYVGDLYLADIGVPPQLYQSPNLGIKVENLFSEKSIMRIW